MKRAISGLWIIPLFLFIFSAVAYGEIAGDTQVFGDLGCTEEEINQIITIQDETENVIRESRIELNLYKAQLEKLLFPTDVNMKEVEKILRASLEWKMKSELADIRRRVEIRKILGERRWERFLKTLRARKQKSKFQEPKVKKQTQEKSKNNDKERR